MTYAKPNIKTIRKQRHLKVLIVLQRCISVIPKPRVFLLLQYFPNVLLEAPVNSIKIPSFFFDLIFPKLIIRQILQASCSSMCSGSAP